MSVAQVVADIIYMLSPMHGIGDVILILFAPYLGGVMLGCLYFIYRSVRTDR